jgi:hypothetical protein
MYLNLFVDYNAFFLTFLPSACITFWNLSFFGLLVAYTFLSVAKDLLVSSLPHSCDYWMHRLFLFLFVAHGNILSCYQIRRI